MPSERHFDPETHLCFGDIWVDKHENPSMLQVLIKCSKTDPYRLGVTLYIGATNTELCPVAAVIEYLLARGSKEGPLFIWQDGCYLTRQSFVQAVREALSMAGMEAKNYASHSFRIGQLHQLRNVVYQSQPSKCWVTGKVQPTCYISRLPGKHWPLWQECWRQNKRTRTLGSVCRIIL